MDSTTRRSAADRLLGSRFISGVFVALIAEARAFSGGGGASARAAGARLEAALLDLSRIFYYAEGPGDRAPLREEMEFAERYLRLQSMRFDGRLEYGVSAEPGLPELLAPRLASFPVLERAVAEDLECSAGAAFIAVQALREAKGLFVLRVERGRAGRKARSGPGPTR